MYTYTITLGELLCNMIIWIIVIIALHVTRDETIRMEKEIKAKDELIVQLLEERAKDFNLDEYLAENK